MNNPAIIGFGVLTIVAVVVLVIVIRRMGNRKLSASATTRIRSMLERADRAGDPVLRVMEYDKVLDQLMLELGFQGSTGQKLMKAGPRFTNKDALWRGHKLRNLVAHEHGATVNPNDADNFRSAVLQAFQQVSR